ncbi:MAG TPA: diguanylate cyclase [Candidatus Sulfotelmatobacter sp.]|nr:diguanylate cyclase [Candidatus Sulfotelmatobacter sp.]
MILPPGYDRALAALLVVLVIGAGFLVLIFYRKATAARDGEARFRMLADAIPQIVWTALPAGDIDYCNQRWFELTGYSTSEALGWEWQKGIHPDDLPVLLENWERACRTGRPFEMEYRIQVRSNEFRWFLVRATPMRDSAGAIVRWFGSCTDVDDQIRNQQSLEEQIKQHTAALLEANERLKSEMHERSLAQEELNRQNERMLRELTRRSNRATMLARMAELLQSCTGLSDVWSVVSGMAPKIFSELRGAVLLLNSSRDTLEVAASWSECPLPAAVFGAQDCWALRTGHAHIVPACDTTAPCRHAVAPEHSYVCLPLLSQGEAIGILHFQCASADELSESELSLATTFSEQIGLSVSNLRLREALRNQSTRDPLTGLFNRRYLEETMQRETRRAVRAEHSLGMILLDLDHFKTFNDTYGHGAGDTVLREAANFLAKCVRAEDIVCRFGGEEFLVILPMADLKATQVRAERIRCQLREKTIMHLGKSLGMVTVSVGVAVLPDHGTAPNELFAAADAALYRAKREGRDRVVVAETANPPAESLPAIPASGNTQSRRETER